MLCNAYEAIAHVCIGTLSVQACASGRFSDICCLADYTSRALGCFSRDLLIVEFCLKSDCSFLFSSQQLRRYDVERLDLARKAGQRIDGTFCFRNRSERDTPITHIAWAPAHVGADRARARLPRVKASSAPY